MPAFRQRHPVKVNQVEGGSHQGGVSIDLIRGRYTDDRSFERID